MKKAAIVLALSIGATSFAKAAEQVTIVYKVVSTQGEAVQTDVPEYNWKTVRVDADKVDETVRELKADPTIGMVEIAQKVQAPKPVMEVPAYPKVYAQGVRAQAAFNDPEFIQQKVWADYADTDTNRGSLTIAQGMDIYDSTRRMKIGVVDGGFVETGDITYAQGVDMVFGNRADGFLETEIDPNCGYRHGTQVSHLAAANRNNGVGMAGIANADVYAARALDCSGSGFTTDIAESILWLAGEPVSGVTQLPEPVDVINLSLNAETACPFYLQDALDVARSRGVVIVASAGNNSDDAAKYYPNNCEGVVNVGSNRFDGTKSSFTNDGEEVDVFATGSDVFTMSGPGQYNYVYGTSFSSPIVAGHVALIKAVEPEADETRIIRLLKAAQRSFVVNGLTQTGAGIMDSLKLAKAVSGETYVARPLVHALNHESRIATEAAYTQASAQLDTCGLYEVDTTKLDVSRDAGEFFKVFEVSKDSDFTVANGTEVSNSQGSRVLLKNINPTVNNYGLSVCNADNSVCDSEIPVNLNASKALTGVYCAR